MDSALRRCAAQRRGLRVLLRNSSVAAAAMALFAGSAWSAEPLPPPIHDFTTYMPTAKATRIEAAEAPTIDGDLSDPIWQKAEPITEFYQTDPDEGQPATERTDVRFLYDAENLYVYVYSYDTHPERIRGTSKNRDGNFGGDDTIRVYLDPSNTRRNGYQFVLNSLGGRLDQLIQNNTDFVREWNAIWAGSARVVDDGWTAEMAIPFKDLSFDPTKPDWVIEFSRKSATRTSACAGLDQRRGPGDQTSRSGTLTGITDINQGLGSTFSFMVRCAIASIGSNRNMKRSASGRAATPSTRSRRN
jgi:hypothetical protein